MNLADMKKLSEIFQNFAQPIATVLAALIAVKLAKDSGKAKRKKKR